MLEYKTISEGPGVKIIETKINKYKLLFGPGWYGRSLLAYQRRLVFQGDKRLGDYPNEDSALEGIEKYEFLYKVENS